MPSGQFGTRLAGGKDAASPRYIFTRLSLLARLLFPEADDPLLKYREDDGLSIEPVYFCPVLPLLLINGSQGIGTGWSTNIPPHNPLDVLAYVRARIDEDDSFNGDIKPWVRGFTGQILSNESGNGHRTIGRVREISRTSVIIDELPVGVWTNKYKTHLINMQSTGEIQSFVENHTTTSVSFKVTMKAAQLQRVTKLGLEKAFKLESSLRTTNMNAFDKDGSIQKFNTADSIADAHFPIRLGLYHDRKSFLEHMKEYSTALARNKASFIEQVIDGTIDLIQSKKPKVDMVHFLHESGFAKMSDLKATQDLLHTTQQHIDITNDRNDTFNSCKLEENHELNEFDYLLNMPLSSLTKERIDGLQSDASKKEKELVSIRETTPKDLWREDLNKIEPYLS